MVKDVGTVDAIKAHALLYLSLAVEPSVFESYNVYSKEDRFLSAKQAHLCIHENLGESEIELSACLTLYLLDTVEQLKGLHLALILSNECDTFRNKSKACTVSLPFVGTYTVEMHVLGAIHAYMSTPQYKFTLKLAIDFI